ncbi:MAG: hypothetical protein LQ346_002419 [Caloplaca aetnensis]|nr:MAG: hypothetical protein LQ346_002419 [Caloplaca aetnensis]
MSVKAFHQQQPVEVASSAGQGHRYSESIGRYAEVGDDEGNETSPNRGTELEAALLLHQISQADHDAFREAEVARILVGIKCRLSRRDSTEDEDEVEEIGGSTRSPSPEPASEEAAEEAGTPATRRIDIGVFDPADTTTHAALVACCRAEHYVTGLPYVDTKGSGGPTIPIDELRRRGHRLVINEMSWRRAHPFGDQLGPEGKETAVLAEKAAEHFKAMYPDEEIKGRKEEEGKRKRAEGGAGGEEEEDGDEDEEKGEGEDEDGAPKRKRRKTAPPTAKKGKGKGKEKETGKPTGNERAPKGPYISPPFSPDKKQGASGFTAVNRAVPNEPVAGLADAAGQPAQTKRKPAKVTWAPTTVAAGEEGGEEQVTAVTARGRKVHMPKKFGD